MLVEEPLEEREPHDFQIEANRPVFDVIQVVLDSFLQRGVAAPAVDLRPASQAGLYFVAEHVLRDLVLELFDEVRPFGPRTDNRHVAAHDIPELRNLVEVRASEKTAER